MMGMAVVFYYEDLALTGPKPDLSIYDICGDVYLSPSCCRQDHGRGFSIILAISGPIL
jgi:hypothetical protein